MSSSRHPFEIFTLVLCVVIGIPAVIFHVIPGSVSQSLPYWWQTIWGAGIASGGGIALLGVAWGRRATGLILEQIGLVLLAMATLIYTYSALSTVGMDAILPVMFIVSFGASCLWRWVQIQRLLNSAQRIVDQNDHKDGTS